MSAEPTGWEPFVIDGGSESAPRQRKRGIKGTGVDERGWERGRFGDDFDLNKYYFQSVNEHDHAKTIHVPIHPALQAMVMQVVESKESAYRSIQDFVRHWCYVGMIKEVEREFTELLPDVEAELARVESVTRRFRMERYEKLIEDFGETMAKAARLGDKITLKLELDDAQALADKVEEPYKSMVQGVIDRYIKQL